ncbi:MAG: PorT family protein [Bacteroidota bacterium]|nr:PorT family protein [Bacteroidota bacterium]
MKIRILIFVSVLFGWLSVNAQTPPSRPTPPTPPTAPTPPKSPRAQEKMEKDTVKIKIKGREILIIEDHNKRKRSTEKEKEEEMENQRNAHEKKMEEHDRKMQEHDSMMLKHEEIMEENDDHLEHPENRNPGIKTKKRKVADVDFLDIDLGVNILLNDASPKPEQLIDDLKIKTFKSWNVTFTFLPTKIYFGTKHLMLMTGFGWNISGLQFKEKISFTPNKTLEYTRDANVKNSNSWFQHLQVPLMLYVESKKLKGLGKIGIGAGGYAGVLVNEVNVERRADLDRSIKTNEDYGLNQYRYGLSGRLDVGALKFFANYNLSPTWEDTDFKTLECGLWFDF